jgi:hypothetical protein
VELGRRDSLTASKTAAENSIPKPTFNVPQLVNSFNAVGLNEKDVVALSGTHCIRVMSGCVKIYLNFIFYHFDSNFISC